MCVHKTRGVNFYIIFNDIVAAANGPDGSCDYFH